MIETLIYLPRYDFAWQHNYQWEEPILMPAGSKLRLTFWWDNSADNPFNPDPTDDVEYGLATTDEMMTGRVFYSKAAPIHHVVGDPVPPELYPREHAWERAEHGVPKFLETVEGIQKSPLSGAEIAE